MTSIFIKKDLMTGREYTVVQTGPLSELGCFNDQTQFNQFLELFELELEEHSMYKRGELLTKVYIPSKIILDDYSGGFTSIEELNELAKGLRLKKVKGLSNGSIVDCYIGIAKNSVRIFRPNINAKEVAVTMTHEDQIRFKKSEWYI